MAAADSWWAGRRVCVTGGSGLIGRALIARLTQLQRITVVVFSRSRHDDLPPQVIACTGDICDSIAVESAIAGSSVVIHLAANKRRQADAEVADLQRTNVDGTDCLLRSCRALGVETVIHASTAYVYAQDDAAIRETCPANPASPYAASKRLAEQLVEEQTSQGNMRGLIARIANVYGDSVEPDTVIGRGLLQALNDTLVFRDLSPIRDFIHVRDVAEALLRLAPHANERCPVVNVSTGIGTSVHDVAEIVAGWAARNGQRPRIETDGASRQSTEDRLVLDNSRLRELTNWQPSTTVADGVSEALDHLYGSPARSL